MKRSGTVLIYIIVWAIVLFSSFVVGICIREVRFYRAREAVAKNIETTPEANLTEEKAGEAEQVAQDEKTPAEEGEGEQLADLPAEQGPEGAMGNMRERMANMTEEERAQMRERFANMSDEERAQMRERMGGGRRRGGGRNLSDEERAQMEERRRQMRERFENMSDEEREAYRSQMRERMGGGRRPRGDGEGGRSRPRRNNDEEQ